jgi:ABC-type uncharacterized transport system involved in gliding motility auxiliary subunit
MICTLLTVVGINLLSMRHFYRFDFQKKHNFALETFSLNTLALLKTPVEIFLFYGYAPKESTPFLIDDLRHLLKEYRHAAPHHIKIKFIDILQQPRMADELSLKFGTMTSNSIVIASGKQFRIIPAADLYEFKNGVASGFCGERIISNEILKLSNCDAKKVLLSTGHGEIDWESIHPINGSSSAQKLLEQNGYLVEKTKLIKTISEKNAKLIIIGGAQTKFTEDEIQILRAFLQRDGRILVLLAPPKSCGLEDLFFDWGILADDMLIFNGDDAALTLSGESIVDNFGEHKIMQPMRSMKLSALLGLSQPVRPDIGSAATKYHRLTPLLASGEKTFAKLDYLQRKLKYNPHEDLMGPVPLATLSEAMLDENTASPHGKLLVVGNVSFVNNNQFCVLGNKILFNAMVTWLLDDADFTSDGIKTRAKESHKINLSKSEFMGIAKHLLFMPLLFLLLGWLIAYVRRNF